MALSKQVKARRQRNRVQRWSTAWRRSATKKIYLHTLVARTQYNGQCMLIMNSPGREASADVLEAAKQYEQDFRLLAMAKRRIRDMPRAEWFAVKDKPFFWREMGLVLSQPDHNRSVWVDLFY